MELRWQHHCLSEKFTYFQFDAAVAQKKAERSERRLSPSLSLSWAAADTLPLLWAIEKKKKDADTHWKYDVDTRLSNWEVVSNQALSLILTFFKWQSSSFIPAIIQLCLNKSIFSFN